MAFLVENLPPTLWSAGLPVPRGARFSGSRLTSTTRDAGGSGRSVSLRACSAALVTLPYQPARPGPRAPPQRARHPRAARARPGAGRHHPAPSTYVWRNLPLDVGHVPDILRGARGASPRADRAWPRARWPPPSAGGRQRALAVDDALARDPARVEVMEGVTAEWSTCSGMDRAAPMSASAPAPAVLSTDNTLWLAYRIARDPSHCAVVRFLRVEQYGWGPPPAAYGVEIPGALPRGSFYEVPPAGVARRHGAGSSPFPTRAGRAGCGWEVVLRAAAALGPSHALAALLA